VNTLVLANFPLAFLIFAAVVGIPLWLSFKRPDQAPEYGRAMSTRSVKTVPAYSTAGLSAARQHAAARTPVPGRLHATARRTALSHEATAPRDRVSA
jgi:hypothetical protein